MPSNITKLTTVAAVFFFGIFATQAAVRPVYASNGNVNWSSTSLNNAGFPNNVGNTFTRTLIDGDSLKTISSRRSTTTYKPRVFIIQKGHTVTVNADLNNMDTLYVIGTLKFVAGTGYDIEMYSLSSGNTGVISGSNYSSRRARRGVVIVLAGGLITGGNGDNDIDWNNGNDIDGSYNVTGPSRAGFSTTASSNPAVRFAPFTPTFTPLPIDLSTFVVKTNETDHVVSFTALGESNRNSFLLEISYNGTDFEYLTEIQGNQEMSEQNYSYSFAKLTSSFYIRLSERNSIGALNPLAITFVTLNSNANLNEIRVFPTLLNDDEHAFNVILPEIGTYTIQIFSTNLKNERNLKVETETENQTYTVEDLTLANGTYIVVVTGANNVRKTEKILVAH